MADVNLASLNFKLILDDGEFNDEITRIKNEADALNKSLSEMLNVHGGGLISKEEHQSAMRRLREEFQEAQNQQKLKLQWSKETAKMANDEAIAAGKITREQEKANNEKKKGLVIDEQIAAATKKKEAAEINAAAATERKVKAERDAARAETQRQTATINQAAAEERRLTAMNNRIRSQQRLNAEMEREGSILRRNSRLWNDMKNVALAYFSFEGARRLISNLVRVSAEFEKQRVSLHAILQDADGAERIFGQIKALAVQSPFQFKELVTYTKQLSAFSIPMNELYDTTKMLADVSAGLGVGMDRLVLAYGQIRSASFLRGQEVRQLTEAGIPILRELSEMFTELEGHYVSAGEVFEKISKRQVTFEMVAQVFQKMTSEGGKFYQMQEVLAETLSGKISNLTDAYQIMFAEIGEKTSGVLNGTVDALRSIAENYQKVGRLIIELVAIYGTYRGMLVAVAAAEKMVAGARMGGEIINMGTAFARAAKEALSFSSVLGKIGGLVSKLNPYAAAAAAVVALGAAIYNLTKRTSEYKEMEQGVTSVIADYNKEVEVETGNLEYLFKQLRQTSTESERYKRVRSEIISQYGQYLTDIDRENLALGKQESVYRNLTNAIRQASMEKALSAGREKISEYMDGMSKGIFEDLQQSLERLGYDGTGAIAKELGRYIRGEINGIFDLSDEAAEAYAKMIGSTEWNKITTGAKNILYYANPYNLIFDPDGKSQRTHNMDELRDAYKEVLGVVEEETERLYDGVEVIYGVWPGSKEAEVEMQNWQTDLKAIADEASEAGQRLGITVDAMSDIIDISKEVDKALEESADRAARYRAAGQEELANAEEDRAAYLSRMQSRLGGPLSSGVGGKAETEDIVSNVQAQIAVYQKLKKAYTDLTEYVSDSDARNFLATIFPQEMAFASFDAEIRRLAASLLTMGEAGVKAAAAYDELFKEDELEAFKRKLKQASDAAKAYEDAMKVWSSFVPSKDGIAKIVSDYEKALAQIEEARTNAMEALYEKESKRMDGMGFGAEFFAQKDEIDVKAFEASSNELVDARAKAEQEIERIYNTWLEQNTKFGKLTDLSLRQLNDLKTEILGFNIGELPAEQQELFAKLIPQVSELNALLEKFKKKSADAVDDEKQEDSARAWKQLAKNIVSSSKALKEFASASNNYALEQLADTISVVGGFVQDVADGFMKAGEMGAVVAGVTSIANFVLQAATRAAQLRSELGAIARDQYFEAIDERIEAASGIFGNSWMGKVRALRHEIQGLTTDMRGLLEGTMYQWEMYAPSISLIEALKRYADELGMELYDANGFYNAKTLEAIQKKYEKAFKARGLTDMLTQLTEYNDKMKELFKEMESSISEMFDTLGGDIADSLIESLKATGSAVTDLEDVFQNLGDSIFKSMVQSYIIDDVLNKYKDEVKSWWTDETLTEADIANRMRDFANSVKADIDFADERLTAMYNAFMENSLLTVANEAEDKSNLGGGVKSITEDTANLLASYINAIRADVAAIRQAVAAEGFVNLPTPTLAEYLTQIQANTYNTAQNTADLLADLRSMMTTSDGPALRVFM